MHNLGELKTEIAAWVDREDLDTKIPDFIRLMETDLYRDLQCEDNEFSVTLTQADNPKNPITLPQNFEELKLVSVNDSPLDRISDQMFKARLAVEELGTPDAFTMIERQLYLHPWSDEDIPATNTDIIKIDYYGTESLVEMSPWTTVANPNTVPESDGTPSTTTVRDDAATTRLFLRNPDLYLAGSLAYAYLYVQDYKNADRWKGIFDSGVKKLKRKTKRARSAGSSSVVASAYGDE